MKAVIKTLEDKANELNKKIRFCDNNIRRLAQELQLETRNLNEHKKELEQINHHISNLQANEKKNVTITIEAGSIEAGSYAYLCKS